MKKPILILMLFAGIAANAQLFVSSTASVDVIGGERLYTAIPYENDGTVSITNGSIFEFDGNFTNDGTMNYENIPANPGILKIGSGTSRSGELQNLQFNDGVTENIPLIQLEKTGTLNALIDRGHVRLTQRFRSISGNLDANSQIVDSPTLNTVTGLTFISPDATTTSIVEESIDGNVDNVLVERYIPVQNRSFRFLSSSVDTNGTIKENLQEGGQIDNITSDATLPLIDNPRPGFGTHVTGATHIINNNPDTYFVDLVNAQNTGLDITVTGNPNMFYYDFTIPDWDPVLDSDDPTSTLSAGRGFSLLIRGDRSLDLTVDNAQTSAGDTTLRTLGDLVIGQFTTSIAPAGGFTLVGNPYQAQVDLIQFITDNLTEFDTNFIYAIDPKGATFGNYVTIDISDVFNTATVTSNITVTPASSLNEILQPNQSVFLVSASSSTGTAIFEESHKINNPSNIDIFSSEDNDFKIDITLFDNDASVSKDGILLRYNSFYSNDVINEDAYEFWNDEESLSFLNQGNYLSVDKRNIDSAMNPAQLFIYNYVNQSYSLDLDISNLPGDVNVYLTDHYLQTDVLLSEGLNTYSFNIDQSISESTDAQRFELNFNNETFSTDNPDAAAAGLNLYPNPASTSVNLSLSGSLDSIQDIQIISMEGKLVKKLSIDNLTSYDMDVSDLSTGVYIINATTQENTFTNKLIIE